jgi:hypothetical protein
MDESLNTKFKELALQYPKFYKMDWLSKIGVGYVDLALKSIKIDCSLYKIGIVFSTTNGSLWVDHAFRETILQEFFPSPSLFVYTLPNIVLGEICIKNEWKGENMVFILEEKNIETSSQYASYMLQSLDMDMVWSIYINIQKTKTQVNINVIKK